MNYSRQNDHWLPVSKTDILNKHLEKKERIIVDTTKLTLSLFYLYNIYYIYIEIVIVYTFKCVMLLYGYYGIVDITDNSLVHWFFNNWNHCIVVTLNIHFTKKIFGKRDFSQPCWYFKRKIIKTERRDILT